MLPKPVGVCILAKFLIIPVPAQQYAVTATSGCSGYYSETATIEVARGGLLEEAQKHAKVFLESTWNSQFHIRMLVIIAKRALATHTGSLLRQSYYDWRSMYLSPDPTERAIVFAIGDSAILTYSDREGTTRDIVLRGGNPYRGSDGVDFEITPFTLWNRSGSRNALDRQQAACTGAVFVRTRAHLGDATANAIALRVLSRISVGTDMLLVIRNDDWFYGFGINRHAEANGEGTIAPPLTKAAFELLPQYNCFQSDDKPVKCQGFGGSQNSQNAR